MTAPLGFTVRQCRICKGIFSWPILDMADAMALSYPHCPTPEGELIGTDFIEIRPREREAVCCGGDSDVGTLG